MRKAVICSVSDHAKTALIVEGLKAAGFAGDAISVLMPDRRGCWVAPWTGSPSSARCRSPGVGSFIAAGSIRATLLAAAAAGSSADGLRGALLRLGVPELEAKRYEDEIREGNVLVSVHPQGPGETRRAKEVFERLRAEGVRIYPRAPALVPRRSELLPRRA